MFGRTNIRPVKNGLKQARKHKAHPPREKEEFRHDSNNLGFICAGESNAGGYKTNA